MAHPLTEMFNKNHDYLFRVRWTLHAPQVTPILHIVSPEVAKGQATHSALRVVFEAAIPPVPSDMIRADRSRAPAKARTRSTRMFHLKIKMCQLNTTSENKGKNSSADVVCAANFCLCFSMLRKLWSTCSLSLSQSPNIGHSASKITAGATPAASCR